MYGDKMTAKDRMVKKVKSTGIFGRRAGGKTKALDKMKGTNKEVDKFNSKKEAAERSDQ